MCVSTAVGCARSSTKIVIAIRSRQPGADSIGPEEDRLCPGLEREPPQSDHAGYRRIDGRWMPKFMMISDPRCASNRRDSMRELVHNTPNAPPAGKVFSARQNLDGWPVRLPVAAADCRC